MFWKSPTKVFQWPAVVGHVAGRKLVKNPLTPYQSPYLQMLQYNCREPLQYHDEIFFAYHL